MVFNIHDASEQTAGTTITTGNTSFTTMTLAGAPTAQFSTAYVMQGYINAYKIVASGAGSDQVRMQSHHAASDYQRGQLWFRLNALPGAICKIAAVLDTAFSQKFTFVIQASNRISINGLVTMTHVLTINTDYRLEWDISKGNTTQNAALYIGNSQTPVETAFSQVVDVGANQFARAYVGVVDTNGKFDGYVQALRLDNTSGTFLGPWIQQSDKVGITDAVTMGKIQTLDISDVIGLLDLPGPQVLNVTLDVTDTVGLADRASPADLSNLLGRWRADDIAGANNAPVSAWSDVDNSYTPLEQTDPSKQPLLKTGALNDHKVVEFDGTDDFLSIVGTALGLATDRASLTVVIVYKLSSTPILSGSRDMFALSDGDSLSQHRVSVYSHSTALHTLIGGRRLDVDSLQSIEGATTLPAGKQGVFCAQFGWSTTQLQLFEDGIQTASSAAFQTAGNTSPTLSLAGAVGARASGTGECFSGQIADILVFNTFMGNTQRASVFDMLTDLYGFPAATVGVAQADLMSINDGLNDWDPEDPVLSQLVTMVRSRSSSELLGITDSAVAVMAGSSTFPPVLSGVGSLQDQFYASLSAYGLNESVMNRWRAGLLTILGISDTGQSATELEFIYLRQLGYSGSMADMRKQAGLINFPSVDK